MAQGAEEKEVGMGTPRSKALLQREIWLWGMSQFKHSLWFAELRAYPQGAEPITGGMSGVLESGLSTHTLEINLELS
jgi:hypothetical protein